eukprot:TRINITY_DN10844_c0_g1_i1.p1 TRINITY_DN10844_c0_g1~~TRINITY_DN10844_c0_g1_i1.p1  ORF type:complete len:103 (-),score=15.78 TRINITY_DN10844_c0_g1_i1:12-320(-)
MVTQKAQYLFCYSAIAHAAEIEKQLKSPSASASPPSSDEVTNEPVHEYPVRRMKDSHYKKENPKTIDSLPFKRSKSLKGTKGPSSVKVLKSRSGMAISKKKL